MEKQGASWSYEVIVCACVLSHHTFAPCDANGEHRYAQLGSGLFCSSVALWGDDEHLALCIVHVKLKFVSLVRRVEGGGDAAGVGGPQKGHHKLNLDQRGVAHLVGPPEAAHRVEVCNGHHVRRSHPNRHHSVGKVHSKLSQHAT